MVDNLKMSPQVDSRLPLFNIWTSKERKAWADKSRIKEQFIKSKTKRVAELQDGRLPGISNYRRALKKQEKGLALIKREEAILRDSVKVSLIERDVRLLEEFEAAYRVVSEHGGNPFGLDEEAEAVLLKEAQNGFKSSLSSFFKSKRKSTQPSPSKPNAIRKALRSFKKKK